MGLLIEVGQQKKTGFVGGLLLHTNDAENPVEAEAVYEYYTFTLHLASQNMQLIFCL